MNLSLVDRMNHINDVARSKFKEAFGTTALKSKLPDDSELKKSLLAKALKYRLQLKPT